MNEYKISKAQQYLREIHDILLVLHKEEDIRPKRDYMMFLVEHADMILESIDLRDELRYELELGRFYNTSPEAKNEPVCDLNVK